MSLLMHTTTTTNTCPNQEFAFPFHTEKNQVTRREEALESKQQHTMAPCLANKHLSFSEEEEQTVVKTMKIEQPQRQSVKQAGEETPSGVALLKKRMGGLQTAQGRLKGMNYQPRSNDVVIATCPKAGTTWMQQICHQLRSNGGDMDFDEIARVIPFLELAHDKGVDLEAPQRFDLRFFKTHVWAEHCPAFSKNVVVFRDPGDVLVSDFKFLRGWVFEPGTVSLEEFAKEFWFGSHGVPASRLDNCSYFVHLASWYKRRHETDTVFVTTFDDLKENLTGEVTRLAHFLSTPDRDYTNPSRIQATVERSSFEFMQRHAHHFDAKLVKKMRNQACGLAQDAGVGHTKIGKGISGQGKLLTQSIQNAIQEEWDRVVLPVTGCANYAALLQQLREERSQLFASSL